MKQSKNFIYIGYDERERDPYDVCIQSIMDNTKNPERIVIKPLYHRELRRNGKFDRPWLVTEDGSYQDVRDGRPFSVQFSHTRFLTPHLATEDGAEDIAMFVDCDFVFQDDVNTLFDDFRKDSDYSVKVVKHEYKPGNATKMDGVPQQLYGKKLWSSLMMFNLNSNDVQRLTPEEVNTQPGSHLHSFAWVMSPEKRIGAIDEKWNFIPDHSENRLGITGNEASAIHYTEGGPWFDNYEDCTYSGNWTKYYHRRHKGGLSR